MTFNEACWVILDLPDSCLNMKGVIILSTHKYVNDSLKYVDKLIAKEVNPKTDWAANEMKKNMLQIISYLENGKTERARI